MKKILIITLIIGIFFFLGCTQPTQECKDSDGGLNYYEAGSLDVYCPTGATCGMWADHCIDEKTLIELSCDNQSGKPYVCPEACANGKCVNITSGECADGQKKSYDCGNNRHVSWQICEDGTWYNISTTPIEDMC